MSFPGHLVKCASILLLLPLISKADGPYHLHPLSEQQIILTYTQGLRDAFQYAERDWHESKFDPQCGYWGDGASMGNEGIRTIAGFILNAGTLLRYDNGLSEAERQHLLDRATAALKFVTATHVTGSQKCPDGKSWGATKKFGPESWQSGMWTGTIAAGVLLMRDKLDPSLQKDIERMIAWEDDILAAPKPPNNLWLDTKAEENGWEVPPLALGDVMFPENPHHAAWHEATIKYMMNTLCTEADTYDDTLVDGKATKEWVSGANLQPDFTLENHNIFHPSYVGCSTYFITQEWLYYTYAHQPIPQAATHHVLDSWRMFQTILLPWGESAYPQGMDWELHGLPFINLYATLATHDHDRLASRLEQSELQLMRSWQEAGKGSLAFNGSKFGIARHSINTEFLCYGLMAHKLFGPSAEPLSGEEAAKQEVGVRDYPYLEFMTRRSEKEFVSFSWKNRIMGLLIPLQGHEEDPFFSTPIPNGLVGSFDLAGPTTKPTAEVAEHSRKVTADGFDTNGTILTNSGRLKQSMRIVSAGDQVVVYEDQVIAQADVTVRKEFGVPIGIENDEISGKVRSVTSQDGETKFEWGKVRPAVKLAGTWANVDDRMGVVSLAGNGLEYVQAKGYSPGISVGSDILYGSFSDQAKQYKKGEQVAHRLVILFVETSAKETGELAKACHVETVEGAKVLRFKTPDGKDVQLRLAF